MAQWSGCIRRANNSQREAHGSGETFTLHSVGLAFVVDNLYVRVSLEAKV